MPIYDFICSGCGVSRSVIVDYETQKGLELICVQCGGVMKAITVNMFNVISSVKRKKLAEQKKIKPCGHTRHCQCAAITQRKPNPFQKQIDEALENVEN